MGKRWKAPGTCTDCGNDAYIRLSGQDGDQVMVCAHCFADRVRSGATRPDERATRTGPSARAES